MPLSSLNRIRVGPASARAPILPRRPRTVAAVPRVRQKVRAVRPLDPAGRGRQNGAMRLLHVPLLASLCFGCASREPGAAPPLPNLEALLRDQAARYPLMQPADLYKLISQATRGPSHLFIGSNSELDMGLLREAELMEPALTEHEPVLEELNPELGLVRVNLRPFLLQGGRIDDLARAIGETNRTNEPAHEQFVASLVEADRLLPSLNLAFGHRHFRRYVDGMWKKEYPPARHSAEYAAVYRPAYRVVFKDDIIDREYPGWSW